MRFLQGNQGEPFWDYQQHGIYHYDGSALSNHDMETRVFHETDASGGGFNFPSVQYQTDQFLDQRVAQILTTQPYEYQEGGYHTAVEEFRTASTPISPMSEGGRSHISHDYFSTTINPVLTSNARAPSDGINTPPFELEISQSARQYEYQPNDSFFGSQSRQRHENCDQLPEMSGYEQHVESPRSPVNHCSVGEEHEYNHNTFGLAKTKSHRKASPKGQTQRRGSSGSGTMPTPKNPKKSRSPDAPYTGTGRIAKSTLARPQRNCTRVKLEPMPESPSSQSDLEFSSSDETERRSSNTVKNAFCRSSECQYYKTGFLSTNDRDRHERSVHNVDGNYFRCVDQKCPRFGKKYARRDNLKDHYMRLHTFYGTKEQVRTQVNELADKSKAFMTQDRE